MSIIAVNFTKLAAERNAARSSGYKIKNESSVLEVKPLTLGKQQTLAVIWKNVITYEPNIGSIEMHGDIVMLSTEAEAKQVVADFAKTKRLPPKMNEAVYNTILNKATVQALIMARDIGLPAPVAMPKVRAAPPAAAAPAPKAAAPAPKKK